MRNSLSASRGFTLVELSVVLVVVGLIIGSVLVGSSILQNSRVTATVNALQSVQSAVSTYNQNYNALPGDDSKAASHFPTNGPTNVGGGNGQIGTPSSYDTEVAADGNGAGESALAWQCLRAAGLIKGAGTDAKPMSNSFGGVIGVQYKAFSNGLTGNAVCASAVPGDAARAIDQRLDDGNAKTGNIQAGNTEQGVAGATSEYVKGGEKYVVCMDL
jgi:prepilin-type N-terminal cleavage/methylation domain-containing protein